MKKAVHTHSDYKLEMITAMLPMKTSNLWKPYIYKTFLFPNYLHFPSSSGPFTRGGGNG